ncbi:MAG: tRNA pseudouridine(55) synthase TruB [Patescibacteria group bacterium]
MQGFHVIDKPKGWSSHDVVAVLRGIFKERKIGHLGTLDPLATGVLVCAVGRGATKQISKFMGLDKEYEVEMELGKRSDTYDATGEVDETGADLSALDVGKIEDVLGRFWGETLQMPPAFSAKKVQGRRAYKAARAGKPLELKPVKVVMQGKDIVWDPPFVRFKVTVSSGTYVRSLVHDAGELLGTGAILTGLRRTRVGKFRIEDAEKIPD